MSKNIFYQAKKNFFKYVALPTLAILSSCSINKEFAEDDIYYSPKDEFSKIEVVSSDSLEKKIPRDTLEIKSLKDLNYMVDQGADATLYWENYFNYSPYRSSLGGDFDGDGIVNAFDIHPWSYDVFDDVNNNGISDELEFGPYFFSSLDFIYWDLYYNYPSWRRNFNYYYWDSPYWRNHWGNDLNFYYLNYDKDEEINHSVRRRSLSTIAHEQENTSRRERVLSREIINGDFDNKNPTTRLERYERPTRRNEIQNYVPERNSRGTKRNNYSPRTNSRRQTITRNSSVRQRSINNSSTNVSRSTKSSTNSSGSSRSSSSSNRSG